MSSLPFKKRGRPTGSTSNVRAPTPPLSDSDELLDTTSETLEELIALRKLKRATSGIDTVKLNAGEKKKKSKARVDPTTGVVLASGMIEGTMGGIQQKGKDRVKDDSDDDPDDAGARTRRGIVKSSNFTGQTNTVDVDKHMMAYIEEELRKRKPTSENVEISKEIRSLDPRDELYKVAEKYRIEKKQQEEGNVMLSAAMLTAIPEVDLGIDTRLRNIEDTEKAKRVLFEDKAKGEEEDTFAADRFYRARRPMESDADALAKARKVAAGEAAEKQKIAGVGRRELATDDQVMNRFKKRQRN